MRILADADLGGLDPTAVDKSGGTPTGNFYLHRDEACTLIRGPFAEEESAWWKLMRSACRQNGIDWDTFEQEWYEEFVERNRELLESLTDDEEGDDNDDLESDDANECDAEDEFADAAEDQTQTQSR